MRIPLKTWSKYKDTLKRVDQKAADEMFNFVQSIGGYQDHVDEVIEYAFALATKYGEAAAAAACEMYDAISAAEGVTVPAAEPAPTATYSETAKAVQGTLKNKQNTVPDTVGRLVKQAGADTMLQNAERDGAQFAWIPMGDTCAFCLTLASRGWQYMSAKALKNGHAEHIHANCDCQYCIRHDKTTSVEGYDPDKYLEMYENAEGDTPEEKIKSMRRDIDAKKRATKSDGTKKKGLSGKSENDKIKPDKPAKKQTAFTPAETIEEADEYLKSLGIKGGYAKGKINLDVANTMNKTITEYRDVFGDNMKLGSVKKWPKQKAEFVAAYSQVFGDVFLYKCSSKDSMMRLLEDAEYQFKYGGWSTGNVEHAFRHELGHAVHSGVGRKTNRDALQALFDSATKDLGWGKHGFDLDSYKREGLTVADFVRDMKEAGKTLSAYGFTSVDEMVAESIAEYMSGKPREFAENVVNTLMGW